jgi:hypothetical protein
MYVDGQNYRRTGRNLRVHHQSVANWVKAAAQKALDAPLPRPVVDEDTVVEVDELFTFVETKKRNVRRHASPPPNALFHELAGRHRPHDPEHAADRGRRADCDCIPVLHRGSGDI